MSESDNLMMAQQKSESNPLQLRPIRALTYAETGELDTGWHQHAEYQLIYAEGGVLYVLTEKHQFLLPAFHGTWIPATVPHKLLSPSEQTKLWVLFFQPREEEVAMLQSVRTLPVSNLAREMILFTEQWSSAKVEEVSPLAHHFYETIWRLVAEWCKEPLALILPYVEGGILEEITQHILENLGQPINIETVASKHGMSGRTLMRLFRNQLNMTFGAYLRTARIVKAVELLTEPSASVLEVAYEVGYKSPSSFSQAFRRLTGMSPQAYIKRR